MYVLTVNIKSYGITIFLYWLIKLCPTNFFCNATFQAENSGFHYIHVFKHITRLKLHTSLHLAIFLFFIRQYYNWLHWYIVTIVRINWNYLSSDNHPTSNQINYRFVFSIRSQSRNDFKPNQWRYDFNHYHPIWAFIQNQSRHDFNPNQWRYDYINCHPICAFKQYYNWLHWYIVTIVRINWNYLSSDNHPTSNQINYRFVFSIPSQSRNDFKPNQWRYDFNHYHPIWAFIQNQSRHDFKPNQWRYDYINCHPICAFKQYYNWLHWYIVTIVRINWNYLSSDNHPTSNQINYRFVFSIPSQSRNDFKPNQWRYDFNHYHPIWAFIQN